MPIEKIIEKITRDAENKIETIMERANEKMNEVTQEIKENKEKKIKEIRKKREREMKTEKNRIISQAKLEKRKNILREREKLIDKVLEEAKKKISRMDPEEYEDYLIEAVEKSVKTLGEDLTIHCNKDNVNKIKEIAHEFDPSIEVQGDLRTIGGIKAISKKGASLNLTLEANLKRKKRDLRKDISNILFSED